MRSAELFAGCGGLALGLSRSGFDSAVMVEHDSNAVATVAFNAAKGVAHVAEWKLRHLDVRDIDWRTWRGEVDLVSGGPPCQPFAIGGKKRGHADRRDMWPEAVRAVAEISPDAFLFENVRNIASPTFRSYLDWIVACLCFPDRPRRKDESHASHLARLNATTSPASYSVTWQVLNAADYGAPQLRHRVIIQGLSASLQAKPAPMVPTHSRMRLLWDQYVTGAYWHRHGLAAPVRPEASSDAARLRALRVLKAPPAGRPWVTLRDAIADLGLPNGRNSHVFQAGARSYTGHTGSLLDLPAKALKAGDHGVPGGENMVRSPDGAIRYLTMREASRLVGLPDDYAFPRSWTETMRQLGNAVPTQLSEAAGRHIRAQLEIARRSPAISVAAE